jgi:RecB family endonuclease NucS
MTKEHKPKLWLIVTYHEPSRTDEAAHAWKDFGVMAIGTNYYNKNDRKNILKMKTTEEFRESYHNHTMFERFLFEVKNEDYVLAYVMKKTIAYIGQVKSKAYFTQENIIGAKRGKHSGFHYCYQRDVKWFSKPVFFSTENLDKSLHDQFDYLKGVTIKEIKTRKNVKEIIEKLKSSSDISGRGESCINEDTVKAGIAKYLHNDLNKLKRGLKIVHIEKEVDRGHRPDFIAEDSEGNHILIECKSVANKETVKQAWRYSKKYNKQYGKLSEVFIIAAFIKKSCKESVKKYKNIKLIEADINFKKIK